MVVNTPPANTKLVSGEELYARGDVGPCELIDGRISKMTPTGDQHGAIEANIAAELMAFVRSQDLGKVRVGEVGIYTSRDPDTVRAADVLFISNERYAKRQTPGFFDIAPDLVVEILSPNDRWSEVTQKLREYFDVGVRLVWVVDPAARSVFSYRSLTDMREFGEQSELPGDDVLPGLSIPVSQLLEE